MGKAAIEGSDFTAWLQTCRTFATEKIDGDSVHSSRWNVQESIIYCTRNLKELKMTCHPQGHLTNRPNDKSHINFSNLHSVILLFAVMDVTFMSLPLLLFLPPMTVFLSIVYDANKTKVTENDFPLLEDLATENCKVVSFSGVEMF